MNIHFFPPFWFYYTLKAAGTHTTQVMKIRLDQTIQEVTNTADV